MAQGSSTGTVATGGIGTAVIDAVPAQARTWWDFIAEVCGNMGLLLEGGDPQYAGANLNTVKDTDLFATFLEANQLVGSTMVLFQEDELGTLFDVRGRAIIGYDETSYTVTLAYAVPRPTGSTVDSTEGYSYFKVLLSLQPFEWFRSVQNAVNSAWPSIFELRTVNPVGRLSDGGYIFDEEFDQVLEVQVRNVDGFSNHGHRPVPRARWTYDNAQAKLVNNDENQTGVLHFGWDLPQPYSYSNIKVIASGRYRGPIETGEYYNAWGYPTIDHEYLLRQSMANAYGMLADNARGQSSQRGYMTKMQYNQELANARKQEVAAALSGILGEVGEK